jgi:hypothetical protein
MVGWPRSRGTGAAGAGTDVAPFWLVVVGRRRWRDGQVFARAPCARVASGAEYTYERYERVHVLRSISQVRPAPPHEPCTVHRHHLMYTHRQTNRTRSETKWKPTTLKASSMRLRVGVGPGPSKMGAQAMWARTDYNPDYDLSTAFFAVSRCLMCVLRSTNSHTAHSFLDHPVDLKTGTMGG